MSQYRFLTNAGAILILLCFFMASANLPAQTPRAASPQPNQAGPNQAGPNQAQPPQVTLSQAQPAVTVQSAEAESTAAIAETQDSNELTPAKVELKQKELREKLSGLESSGLSEEDRKKAAEFYQKAIDALASWLEHHGQLLRHRGEAEKYETDLAKFQTDLKALGTGDPQVDLSGDVTTLEQRIASQEQEVQKARDELAVSEKQPKNRQTRLAEIPKLMVERQQELEKVTSAHSDVSDQDATDVLANAERNYLWSRMEALKMSLAEMEEQRLYFTKSPDLVQVRRDFRAKKLAHEEKKLAALRDAIDKRRIAEAEKQASETTRTAAVERPAAIAKLAEQNVKLANKQVEIAEKGAALTATLEAVGKQRDKLVTDFNRDQERIEAATIEASGQQLRQREELLPDIRELTRRIALREQEREDVTYESFELIDRRSEVVDADVEQRVADLLADVPVDQQAMWEPEVRELLAAELKIIDSAKQAYDSYLQDLPKLSAAEDELRAKAQEYKNFIAEHVLWIRSTSVPRAADLAPAADAVRWSIDPQNWRAALLALRNKAVDSPLVVTLFVAVLGFSLYMHQRLRRRLREIGEQAAKRTSTDFWPSLEALWITLLLSLPWPGLLWFVGWWMDSPLNDSEFVRSLSVSLQFTAGCLLLLELVRHLCRSAGLADAHFNWPQSCLLQVRRHVRWLIWMCLPLVVWLTGLEVQNVERLWSSSLGRACFVAVMAFMSFAAYRVLLSRKSPFRQLLMNNSETSEAPWLFHLWSPVVTFLPLVLAVLAIVGYYYTAQKLSVQLLQTAAVVLGLLIMGGLTKRWILLNRRKLAREQAKQKRAQAAAAAEKNVSDETPSLQASDLMEDSVDLVALGEQTSKMVFTVLVVAGLTLAWFVWAEMLPALSSLDKWPILPERNGVENPLTWGDLLQFVLVVVVSFVAVRNLPALMEFALLQRLPLDGGSRYAITSISRYVLAAIGITVAYQSLGFTGTSIQWLVAAMGVGLGFGLQEIFANFVSGIILLFERPIRVGDVVTLGEKTGVVSRIRMRATTILDPDRKEYIVPNKDLITERLLNWTLSDSTNRIEIKVGIAYGSDTDLACRLLKETAANHPLILKDPEPVATFDGFGASTLDFTLRCFLPSMEKRLMTIHELNTTINEKFQAANLEMAYPQTDVYIKTVPPELTQWAGRVVSNGHTNGHSNGKEPSASHGDKKG
jgi:potassium efflux system protein